VREIAFILPFALPSLNVRDRRHRYRHGQDKKAMNLEVLAAIGGSRYLPRPPFKRARVTIVRCSSQRLDPDGLPAVAKNLLDVLCVQSKVHPTGLGVLVDDSPKHLELIVEQFTAAPGSGSTAVRITCLDEEPSCSSSTEHQ
jgi:hypothetical protein